MKTPIENAARSALPADGQVAVASAALVLEEGKNQTKNNQTKNNTNFSIRGGDIATCLSSVDVDAVLRAAGAFAIESALFFHLRQGTVDSDHVRRKINTALENKNEVHFVAHFRHHWVTMRFFVRPSADDVNQPSDIRGIEVFDSAPSPMVSRDICRLCIAFDWPAPVFVPSPRQERGSDECGLFALAAVFLLRTGCSLPIGTFVLRPLRSLLPDCVSPEAPTRTQALDRFVATARAIYGIAPDDHRCDICGKVVPIPTESQRANIIKTHLQSKFHP